VREFCELAFGEAGLDWREYVRTDERFYRPAEVDLLIGDATKARTVLGWAPSYSFEELVREMAAEDLKAAQASSAGRRVAAQGVADLSET
jgi:GDPmannose 4,6-dehydratase